MAEIIAALGGGEARDTLAQQRPERVNRAAPRGAHQRFELRETELDRIEIWTVGRQVAQRGAGGFDRVLDAVDVMRREVIGDDDVAGRERGDQDLGDVGEKAVAVHRAVDHPRCGQSGDAQAGDKGAGLPARHGRVITDSVAAQAAPVPPQQIRRDAGFIEKDEARGVPRRRGGLPLLPRGRDVGPIVFGGAHRFF
jgi:hypothetical protein